MEFETFEEARRCSLFQAGMRPTVVVQRGETFWTLPEIAIAPDEKVLGRAAILDRA